MGQCVGWLTSSAFISNWQMVTIAKDDVINTTMICLTYKEIVGFLIFSAFLIVEKQPKISIISRH